MSVNRRKKRGRTMRSKANHGIRPCIHKKVKFGKRKR